MQGAAGVCKEPYSARRARPISINSAASCATIAVSLCASAARAEAPADAEPADTDGKVILEEIVITADRKESFGANYVQAGTFRNAEVMDTPLTVNILPRTLLDAQQASSIGDALKNSAGVTYTQTNPSVTSNISIRGIPVDNRANYRMNGGLPIVNLVDLPLEATISDDKGIKDDKDISANDLKDLCAKFKPLKFQWSSTNRWGVSAWVSMTMALAWTWAGSVIFCGGIFIEPRRLLQLLRGPGRRSRR